MPYKPLWKTDVVVEHSFILQLEDFSYEYLLKEGSKILQNAWQDGGGSSWRCFKDGIVLLAKDGEELTLVNKRLFLIMMVESLKDLFPCEFNKVGWWDRQVAVGRRATLVGTTKVGTTSL